MDEGSPAETGPDRWRAARERQEAQTHTRAENKARELRAEWKQAEVLDRFRRGKALPADKRPAAYRLSYDRSLTASIGELAHLLTDRLPPFHWYQEKVGPLRDALERVAGWILDEPLTVNIKTLEIVRKRS
jgi:hypothetical protein